MMKNIINHEFHKLYESSAFDIITISIRLIRLIRGLKKY